MVDNLVLVLTHGLLLLAAWRLLSLPDLDDDAASAPSRSPGAAKWPCGGDRA